MTRTPGCSARALLDLLDGEALVHAAEAVPEDHASVLEHLGLVLPPSGLCGFHIGIRSSGTPIALAVLRPRCWSGKNSTRCAALEGPLEHRLGVRGGADDAAVAAAEPLERGRGVHVRDRDHRDPAVGVRLGAVELGELLPALLDRVDVGHVGHRAARREVGQDDALAGPREDVRGLGHEVHAAEHDRLGIRHRLRRVGELERVAEEVGVLDDLVPLIEVAEDHHPVAECRLRGADARVQLLVRGSLVLVRQHPLPRCAGWDAVAHRRARPVAGPGEVEGPRSLARARARTSRPARS